MIGVRAPSVSGVKMGIFPIQSCTSFHATYTSGSGVDGDLVLVEGNVSRDVLGGIFGLGVKPARSKGTDSMRLPSDVPAREYLPSDVFHDFTVAFEIVIARLAFPGTRCTKVDTTALDQRVGAVHHWLTMSWSR